jgi:hypothetical protein
MLDSTSLLDTLVAAARPGSPDRSYPHRAILVGAEAIVALGGIGGSLQLLTGTATPPVADLEPIGLTSWVLPGIWLFATVAVPSSAAAWLAWRRAPLAPAVVLVASGTLALELAVQIPFIGPSALQAVFGAFAVGLAGLALDARRLGWWHTPLDGRPR